MLPGIAAVGGCVASNPTPASTMSGNWADIFDTGNNSVTATNADVVPGAGTISISDFSGSTPEGAGNIKIYKNDINQGTAWSWSGDVPVDLGLSVVCTALDRIRFVATHASPEEVVSFTATVQGNDGVTTSTLDTFLVILTTT